MSKNLFKQRPEKVEKKFIWSAKEKAENVSPTNQVELNAMVETLDKINSKIAEGVTQSDIARTQLNATGAVAPADIDRIRSTLVTLMDAVTTKRNKLSTGHENVSAISNVGTVTEIIRENEQTPAEYAAAQPEQLSGGIPVPPKPVKEPVIELTQFEVDELMIRITQTLIDDGLIIRKITTPEGHIIIRMMKPYLLAHAVQWPTLSHDERRKLLDNYVNMAFVDWARANNHGLPPRGARRGHRSPRAPPPAPPPGPPPAPPPAPPAPPGPSPAPPAPTRFPPPDPTATDPGFTPKKPTKTSRVTTNLNPTNPIFPQNIWIPYYGEFDRGQITRYLEANLRYRDGVAPTPGDVQALVNNPNYLSQIITIQDGGVSSPATKASYDAGVYVMKVVYGLYGLNNQQMIEYDSEPGNPHSRHLSNLPRRNGIFLRLSATGPNVWV